MPQVAGAGGDRSPGQTPGWDCQDGQPGDASPTSLGAPGWVPDEPHEAGQRPPVLVREGGDGGPWTPRIHAVARRGSVRAWCRWRHSPGLCEALVSVTGPGAGGGRRGLAGWHHCGCCPSPGVAWPRPWGTALSPRALPSRPGPFYLVPRALLPPASSAPQWRAGPGCPVPPPGGTQAQELQVAHPGSLGQSLPSFLLLMDQGQHGQQRRGPGHNTHSHPTGLREVRSWSRPVLPRVYPRHLPLCGPSSGQPPPPPPSQRAPEQPRKNMGHPEGKARGREILSRRPS